MNETNFICKDFICMNSYECKSNCQSCIKAYDCNECLFNLSDNEQDICCFNHTN